MSNKMISFTIYSKFYQGGTAIWKQCKSCGMKSSYDPRLSGYAVIIADVCYFSCNYLTTS